MVTKARAIQVRLHSYATIPSLYTIHPRFARNNDIVPDIALPITDPDVLYLDHDDSDVFPLDKRRPSTVSLRTVKYGRACRAIFKSIVFEMLLLEEGFFFRPGVGQTGGTVDGGRDGGYR